jgi:hypothetical protein
MSSFRLRTWALVFAGVAAAGTVGVRAADRSISSGTPTPAPPATTLERLHHWNHVAIDSTGLDHAPDGVGSPHTFGHHLGPGRASRAMAIVHLAVFEAVNAIDRRYESWLRLPAVGGASIDAAIAQAAHDTLVSLYPSQRADCDRLLAEDLAQIPAGPRKRAGILLGKVAAARVLSRMESDGSNHVERLYGVGYVAGNGPGEWRQDPISQLPAAFGAKWGRVRPFVIPSGQAFRVPPPPRMSGALYAAAFREVKALGGDGVTTPTVRTPDQTLAGIYWAYDGTPSLCAPPRLYNQIAEVVANQMGSDIVDQARLFALLNVGMADAAIAIWDSKFFYRVWRPVTGIREADPGSGPSGLGDGNPRTIGDAAFSPLGAPASNLNALNFTPPFPAYPSGHAGFGGVLFQTLRNVYGRDDIAFTFVSDELNGVTVDNEGVVRPLVPRSFSSLSQAEEENGQSRIYLGIHWSFDKTVGIQQGRNIANYIHRHAFRALR